MWHLTHETWLEICDTWHVTCDTCWRVNFLSKFQLPRSKGLGFMMSWRFGGKDDILPEWMTKVFVEQAPLHWVCWQVVPDWTHGYSMCGRCLTHVLSPCGALRTRCFPVWTLKRGGVPNWNNIFVCFLTQSAHIVRVNVSCMQDFFYKLSYLIMRILWTGWNSWLYRKLKEDFQIVRAKFWMMYCYF